ncbi:hypothetical protein GCM10007242_27060 [Pigmentiphaga litoralis]|uniref:hypothetical protein n=1 Tax=Pigmentiphaga litoralis TaxID=516702 RepID=UPI00167C3FBF|nr:hypothetical protein [Pigmentiphaga litoralis]GGX18820.1 hypothetical protein GCM10007242_27060 [Pigmentiphaga litoralis]
MKNAGLKCCLVVVWFAIALLPSAAQAFQVLPRLSDVDRKLTGLGGNRLVDGIGQWIVGNALPMIKSPVHEAITLNALDCVAQPGSESQCLTETAIRDNQILLYGVRWPDDPPFALNRASPPRIADCNPRVTLRSTAQPKCWKALFTDAERTAKARTASRPGEPAFGPGDYLLYRSHFGDLQFFHSMAAHDGEVAAATQRRMKMWAEFLWGIAVKTVPVTDFVRDVGVGQLDGYFPGDMTATNLFATGIIEVRKDLDKVAVGALLHMLQDSFSQAHAGREPESGASCDAMPRFAQPGKISQFYSYAGQVGTLHDHEDTFDALGLQTLQSSPSVVDASRAFLMLWHENAPWSEAEKYFDCAFALAAPSAPAGSGPFSY